MEPLQLGCFYHRVPYFVIISLGTCCATIKEKEIEDAACSVGRSALCPAYRAAYEITIAIYELWKI